MLEKQKVWVQEKKEKGKEWFKAHKLGIGIVAGSVATVGLQVLKKKVFNPKIMYIQTGYDEDLECDNFLMRVSGEDRFGRMSYHSPWVPYQGGLEDKERIDNGIMAAINRDEKSKSF